MKTKYVAKIDRDLLYISSKLNKSVIDLVSARFNNDIAIYTLSIAAADNPKLEAIIELTFSYNSNRRYNRIEYRSVNDIALNAIEDNPVISNLIYRINAGLVYLGYDNNFDPNYPD